MKGNKSKRKRKMSCMATLALSFLVMVSMLMSNTMMVYAAEHENATLENSVKVQEQDSEKNDKVGAEVRVVTKKEEKSKQDIENSKAQIQTTKKLPALNNKKEKDDAIKNSIVKEKSVRMAAVRAFNSGAVLPIAQYVTQDGAVQCGTDKKSAIYNGVVKMKVPMSEVLAGHEADMKNAADKGWYPHGKDGKNKIAYIEYAVTFPENVTFGEIATSETSSMISRVETAKGGTTVNFKIYLNDVNWEGIYQQYLADKANPGAHTVNIEIPYSITANSKEEAAKYDSASISGSGSFEFHASGTFYAFTKQVYYSDTASKPFASGMQACFGEEPAQPEEIKKEGDLEGDILIGDETEHTKVYETKKDASLDFTGALNVKPIKDEMKMLEGIYSGAVGAGITVSEMKTEFTASITLPKEMKFTKANPEVTLDGAKGKFEITESKLEGNTVKVRMTLKDADKIKTYKELSDAISSVDDTLKVTVKGATFTDEAKPDTEYTVKGTVGGSFTAKAENAVSGKVMNFTYTWNGKQSKDGADVKAPDSENIQFTLKYKEKAKPEDKPNPEEKPNPNPNPKPAPNPNNPSNPSAKIKENKPKTGDNSDIAVWLFLLMGATGVLGTLGFVRKKKYKNEK